MTSNVTAPDSICGVRIDEMADWSEPEQGEAGFIRHAMPTRLYQVMVARRPDLLERAGIRMEWHGTGGARHAVLVQVMDAPPPVRRDDPVRTTIDADGVRVNAAGLLKWQPRPLRALKHFWQAGQRAFLDASDTGTGKTYVALAFGRELRREVKCVTRKPARTQWRDAAAHIGVKCEAWNYEALKTGRHPWVRWVRVRPKPIQGRVQPVQLWPEWQVDPEKALLVFDEVQWCKSPDYTLNSKLLLTAAWRGIPLHMMSATVATSPIHLRAVGYALGLHDNRDFHGWLSRHGCVQSGKEWLFNNSKAVMRSLHENIFSRCAVRIRTGECEGFPEVVNEAVLADFPPEVGRHLAVFRGMMERMEARISGYADGRFTEAMAARQRAEAAKVVTVCDQAREDVAEGRSVALFFNFHEAIELAVHLTGWPVIVGGQRESDREEIRRAFCADEIPGIICNSESGGVALSLHGRRPRRGHIMPTWKADTLKQVLGRLPRAGGAFTHQTIWFAAGTIEDDICANVRKKLNNLDMLNDGDVQGAFALTRARRKT